MTTPPNKPSSFASPVSSVANVFASKEQLTQSSSTEMSPAPGDLPVALAGRIQPGYPDCAGGAPIPYSSSTSTIQVPPVRRAPASQPAYSRARYRAPRCEASSATRQPPAPSARRGLSWPGPRTQRPSLPPPREIAPQPQPPWSAYEAATTHLLPGSGRRRRLSPCPPPSLRPPAPLPGAGRPASCGRASCSGAASSPAPAGPLLRGVPTPTPPPASAQGNKLWCCCTPDTSAASTGQRQARTSAASGSPCPRTRELTVERRGGFSIPRHRLPVPFAPAKPGARCLRPPLSALFVAVKA